MWAIDWDSAIRALLYALFAGLTGIIAALIGPSYDNLLVPELSPSALYPAIPGSTTDPSNYLALASRFSEFTLGAIVDPAIALIAVAVAVLYLAKAVSARFGARFDGFLPRLLVAVIAANFTVPIAGALLGLGGALYPILAGWDGGAWHHWVNLAGSAEVSFSWDNGFVAFVTAIAEFVVVYALIFAVAFRDALLGVLLVLLPLFTLLWPFGVIAPVARRAWLLFVELVFLPCILVVPLELAVHSPSAMLLIAYLAAALGSPFLISTAGVHLAGIGFSGGGSTVAGGLQQGLRSSSTGASGYLAPLSSGAKSSGATASAIGGAARAAGSAAAPAAAPLVAAQLVGHGAHQLIRHVGRGTSKAGGSGPGPWPPIRGGGSG